jgi:hypothetical protein
MFHRRSSEFQPRIAAITEHLRSIRKELGAIGDGAGQRASAGASDALDQIAEAIRPVLEDIEDRFRAGRRMAVDKVANLGNEAVRLGSKAGSQALDRVSERAEEHPLATIGMLSALDFLSESLSAAVKAGDASCLITSRSQAQSRPLYTAAPRWSCGRHL